MSSISLQVELPQYAHSFIVNVPQSGTVHEVKQEIARACPGNPRIESQRLIWRGRVLADTEKIEQIWKSPDERTVHLAVNPWGWSGQPPEIPTSTSTSSLPSSQAQEQTFTPGSSSNRENMYLPVTYPISPYFHSRYASVFFIDVLHTCALEKLTRIKPSAYDRIQSAIFQEAKSMAKTIVTSNGYVWPAIFDEDYPAESQDEGVKYEIVIRSGIPYYQLATPDATPTPQQLHALRILTYTFPLLSLPAANPGIPMQLIGQSTHSNHLPNINVAVPPGMEPQIQIRAVPLRALLTPVILLCLRTLLLLYFFSPARKPIFGLLLGAWVVYEAWGAIRGVIGDLDPNDGRRQVDRGIAAGDGNRRPDNEVVNAAGHGMQRAPNPEGAEAIMNNLAHLNFPNEAQALDTDENGTLIDEPRFTTKIRIFVGLFFLSFHPAIWNRRRIALREREGRVRTELMALEGTNQEDVDSTEDERAAQARAQVVSRHTRRPLWVRQYMERVRRGEWVDD